MHSSAGVPAVYTRKNAFAIEECVCPTYLINNIIIVIIIIIIIKIIYMAPTSNTVIPWRYKQNQVLHTITH